MEEMSILRRQWPTSLLTGMTRRQTDLELLRRECKNRFRDSQAGRCTYCGGNIVHDMARHVSNYHLDLGQLWPCSVSWCTQCKGTPQGCIDHICARHHMGVLVKTANLGKWFLPWTVTRSAWNAALKMNVSGISTDVVLLSEHGAQLVQHYRVFGDCVALASLRGTFMIELLYFTNRACAEARWTVKHSRDSGAGSGLSPDRPHSDTMHRTPDDDSPARKAAPAVTSATQDELLPVSTVLRWHR